MKTNTAAIIAATASTSLLAFLLAALLAASCKDAGGTPPPDLEPSFAEWPGLATPVEDWPGAAQADLYCYQSEAGAIWVVVGRDVAVVSVAVGNPGRCPHDPLETAP